MQLPLNCFCSYASEDRPVLEKAIPFLMSLERSGLARLWYDGLIEPGTRWATSIQEALDKAHIILFLVSPNFIASEYCMTVEMPRAIARQNADEAVVVPILIRPTPLLEGMVILQHQFLPRGMKPIGKSEDPDEVWTEVVVQIDAHIRRFADGHRTPWKLPGSGLRLGIEFRAMPTQAICVFDLNMDIGRSPACDIALTRAPQDVGRLQARLAYRTNGKRFVIEPLSSTSGTFVNGERIAAPTTLSTGSRVQFGSVLAFTFMHYRWGSGTAGALVYSAGADEIARYVLAPSGEVGFGTTVADALRVPKESDGLSGGRFVIKDSTPYFVPESGAEFEVDNGQEFQVLSRWVRVRAPS